MDGNRVCISLIRLPCEDLAAGCYFTPTKRDEPIKVDGTLTVYVFDETNRDPNNVRPDRKYVFTKEQFPSHYSKSKFGHSYSVWIPWDEAGGEQKEISMIVRFHAAKRERGGGRADETSAAGKDACR